MSHSEDASITADPSLQKYYDSLESRAGYRLFLGRTRHFGYYAHPTSSGVRVGRALRAMEAELCTALALPAGSHVLDAGCGAGHVAVHLAQTGGHTVTAVDVVARHVAQARRSVAGAGRGVAARVAVRRMDYGALDALPAGALDGVCTMETLVHAGAPGAVLAGFHRVLRPGGRVALHEYDHVRFAGGGRRLAAAAEAVSAGAAMPGYAAFEQGVLEGLLREAGFVDVRLVDLSAHIVPMLRLFYAVAVVPHFFARLLGLERRFVNTLTGVEAYRGRKLWRYVQVTARKPAAAEE